MPSLYDPAIPEYEVLPEGKFDGVMSFDVLEHIAYSKKPIQRATRVANAESKIHNNLDASQKEFIDFVLSKYVEGGVDELDINRLSDLLKLKYKSLHDGQKALGGADLIKDTFINFQKHLLT